MIDLAEDRTYAVGEMKGLAFCVVWFLIAPPGAYGDGCFIPPTAYARVEIPDQRALIHFDQGTEMLVIDTAFKGAGTNFAWIVPVPSRPKVETATPGLFTTLQTIFQPKIIHYIPRYYWFAIIPALFVFHLVWGRRSGLCSVKDVVALWLIGLICWGLIAPSLAKAGVSADPIGEVNVVERKRVGVYDTAVLSSPDGGALLDWLGRNGFVTPTNFIPAIQAYAKEGWFFVASKIRLNASLTDPVKPSPLALTFKTERPVYPLRLTGIGNESCRIELYVFGPDRAAATNFIVERCAMPLYPATTNDDWRGRLDQLRIRHPGLRGLVDQSPVATKLTARLTSQQMNADAYITWAPFEEKRLVFYSEHGAALLATNITVPFMVVACLIMYWIRGREGVYMRRLRIACVLTVFGAVLVWQPISMLPPKIPVVVQVNPERRNRYLHDDISRSLRWVADDRGTNSLPDIAWVRQQLGSNSLFRRDWYPEFQTNYFTGQPWHEEDSPGNYTLRQTTEGIEYVWYDIEGGEHAEPLFGKNE